MRKYKRRGIVISTCVSMGQSITTIDVRNLKEIFRTCRTKVLDNWGKNVTMNSIFVYK